MNPQDPLAALHPLREPLPIGWWPPAPGWWLLAVLLLAAILVLGWLIVRRYRAKAYRRLALLQFKRLVAAYRQSGDARQFLTDTNALIKSVALVAYPRRQVAASNGASWLAFLNQALTEQEQFPPGFAAVTYSADEPDLDLDRLQQATTAWIKKHEVQK